MRPVCYSLGYVFVVLTSAKSNDITNIFVKSILVQKKMRRLPYTILLCPLNIFEIKNKDLRPL